MTAVLGIQGRGRRAFCRPVLSFSEVARQVGIEDEDRLRFAVPSRPGLLAVPDDYEQCRCVGICGAFCMPHKVEYIERHPIISTEKHVEGGENSRAQWRTGEDN